MKNFSKNLFFMLLTSIALSSVIAFTSKVLPLNEALKKPVAKHSETAIPSLSLPDTIRMFHNPNNIFVDVRETRHYKYGHIAGAINIPAQEIDNLDNEKIAELKQKTHVIIYWNSGCCGVVWNAARKLRAKGLDNVRVYADGWPQWKSCRLPIESEKKGEE